MDSLVERYLKEGEARGLAAGTLDRRGRELERFGLWLKRRRPKPALEAIDADTIVAYVRSRTPFHSRATVCGVVGELRGMGEFLVREGLWQVSPLRWMKGPKIDPRSQIPRRVSRAQMHELFAAAGRRRQEYSRYQAVCALAILYATGLRRGELERLDVDDWDRDAGLLAIDGRKTGSPRRVPVGAGAWRCIEAYLPHRHNVLERAGRVGEPALLVARNGERLTGPAILRIVREVADKADIPAVTVNQLRHSCASDLLRAGASLPEVQRMLGHAAIESTVRYAQIADPDRAAAMDKHPINEVLAGERSAP
jgi:site-specific recombinase XerD